MIEYIKQEEFSNYENTNSRAFKDELAEWRLSIKPEFTRYTANLLEFISQHNAYPLYRVDKTGSTLTGAYEDKTAKPITFAELINRDDLRDELVAKGLIGAEYKNSDNTVIISYHCSKCNIFVIKDGIHRLTTWGVYQINKEITVYQVSSNDWLRANSDMPNFCTCKTI